MPKKSLRLWKDLLIGVTEPAINKVLEQEWGILGMTLRTSAGIL